MLQIDNRAGSSDFIEPLRQAGMEVVSTRMDFGDISFIGFGPNKELCSVGLEVKSTNDVMACVTSGRFAGHQLPGLIRSYDHVWLLVYGMQRTRADGVLEEARYPRKGGMYWAPAGGGQRLWYARDLESWYLSMSILGGIRIHRVNTFQEAVYWVKTVYNWYSREEHKSHLAIYSSKEIYGDTAMLVKPPLARRVAKELPQIGLKRSKDCAERFKTVYEMANASEEDWRRLVVDGGKVLGTRGSQVYKAIRGGKV